MSRGERGQPRQSEAGQVVALSHEGAGVVRAGKAAFVPGALPGEVIRFQRRRRHRQFDDAVLEQIDRSSPDRVAPRCAHFSLCGGCALQHLDGAAQLRFKEQQVRENLERIGRVMPHHWLPAISGPAWGYRRRARLGVRYVERKGRVLVGFRERQSSLIAAIERCEVLCPPLDGLIAPLAQLIGGLSIREQLPQIEVALGDEAAALVLRVLRTPADQDLQDLRDFESAHGVHFYLQSGGLDTVRPLSERAPALHYALAGLDGRELRLQFQPTDFIQINREINRELVAAAARLLELSHESRLLDLFCGLGNFSLALAAGVQQVVGVEGERTLVERARGNAARNGVANAEFHAADLAAPPADAAWMRGRYSHVLLDPPRAGAREMIPLIAQAAPRRVLYVSCHPGTLARDLGVLVHEHGFALLAAGVVDMFPHTAHVESLALLAPPA